MKKVKNIVDDWFEKYGENNQKYPKDKIAEIATNCVSLSTSWFDRVKKVKGVSYEIVLYNKEGAISETFHGVNEDNIASTMLDILVNKNDKYSKLSFNCFKFEDGRKEVNSIGELEIC